MAFFRRSTVLFVAGKGGVGKSTVTAVVALAAARLGLRVLAVELEGRGELPRALGLDGAARLGGARGGRAARGRVGHREADPPR